ncbi:glycosyltransferase family 2 protein [Emticicia sp. SJ17W-69]|uniref:glycosyltransferase family 2 protein n=1 Tax=Emticicia sp. SJ17W-69 TaxID=3421657 RepID=UPI003EB92830
MYLSVVSPVYRAEEIVEQLVSEIHQAVSKITDAYEIVLVEDGSPDQSWKAIQTVCQQDKKVKGVKLSRNFGQHAAITAGLEIAQGEWIVVMDCDLQDRPDEIPHLLAKAQSGYELVFAQRQVRQDGFFKKLSSKLFYKVFSYLTDTVQDSSVANFGIYHRKVIDAVISLGDNIRFFPTMTQWVGFKKAYLPVKHDERVSGKTSYSWKKLIELAFNNIISFSDKPLRLTVRLGLLMSLFSVLLGMGYLYLYFTDQIKQLGFASIIISITFFSGLIIFILGIIGIYLGKTFEQVKERPTHIIDQKLNF